MPKTYLTIEERLKAEARKRDAKQDRALRAVMHDKIYRKINYDYIRDKTGLSKPTIVKIINHPELATVAQLRAVCAAADIPLLICAE